MLWFSFFHPQKNALPKIFAFMLTMLKAHFHVVNQMSQHSQLFVKTVAMFTLDQGHCHPMQLMWGHPNPDEALRTVDHSTAHWNECCWSDEVWIKRKIAHIFMDGNINVMYPEVPVSLFFCSRVQCIILEFVMFSLTFSCSYWGVWSQQHQTSWEVQLYFVSD